MPITPLERTAPEGQPIQTLTYKAACAKGNLVAGFDLEI